MYKIFCFKNYSKKNNLQAYAYLKVIFCRRNTLICVNNLEDKILAFINHKKQGLDTLSDLAIKRARFQKNYIPLRFLLKFIPFPNPKQYVSLYHFTYAERQLMRYLHHNPMSQCHTCGKSRFKIYKKHVAAKKSNPQMHKKTKLVCKKCKVTVYCSKKCQKIDWNKRMHNLKPAMHVEVSKQVVVPDLIKFTYNTEKKLDFCIDKRIVPYNMEAKKFTLCQALAFTALNIGFIKK